MTLQAHAEGLLRALSVRDSETNVAKVLVVLRTVAREAKASVEAENARLHHLLDDANRMLGRMAMAAAPKPGD